MSDAGLPRAGIAALLRVGTLTAMAALLVGYLAGLLTGDAADARPILDELRAGGASTIVAIGLIGLTLVPVGVVALAGIGFRRSGERRLAITAAVVLVLLLGSLGTAVLLATVG